MISCYQWKKEKKLIQDYKCENFSEVFFNILISYTNYVNEYNWKKRALKLRILFFTQYFWPENFRINEIVENYKDQKKYNINIISKLSDL